MALGHSVRWLRAGRMRQVGLAVGAAVVVAAVAGCGSSSSGSSKSSGSDGSVAGKRVAVVGGPDSNPWSTVFNNTVKDELEKQGAKITVSGTLDPAAQVQMLNQAVSSKPDILVLQALDSTAVGASIRKAKAQGVKIVNVDGRAVPDAADGLNQVLSDNEALGRFAAQNVVEGLQGQGRKSGNVAVISGTAAMLVTQDRMKGFKEVMGKHPEYKVVTIQDGNWDPVKSGQIATQILAKYGRTGLQAAYGMADYMAIPILTAAKQAGVKIGGKDGLIVTGGNCFKVGIDAIRAGQLYGTATEDPGTLGRETAAYVASLLAGKDVPLTKTVAEARVTKDTLAKYAEQCSKA
jgi:ABC-type sugar transport system substrate-binding protein